MQGKYQPLRALCFPRSRYRLNNSFSDVAKVVLLPLLLPAPFLLLLPFKQVLHVPGRFCGTHDSRSYV